MTDKVQKIREEVVEIVNSINPFIPDEDGKDSNYEAGKLDAATQILQIIDSMQLEEIPPKFPIISQKENPVCAFSTNRYTDEDRKVLCDGCEEKCEYSKKEEPVSEDLKDAAIEICSEILKGETIIIDGYEYVVLSDAAECFKAGAQWQLNQIRKENEKNRD